MTKELIKENLRIYIYKGYLLQPTFTESFKIETVNQNSFKVNTNGKLHSYNRANLKRGMYYFFSLQPHQTEFMYTRNLIDH